MSTETAQPSSNKRLQSAIIASKFPWYTDAVRTLPNFTSCIKNHEELNDIALAFELFENHLFSSDNEIYRQARCLLQCEGEVADNASPAAQTSPPVRKVIDIITLYQFFDRLWLFLNPTLLGSVLLYPNTLEISAFQSYMHLGNVKRILLKLFELAKKLNHDDQSVFNAKISRESGTIAQMKQLITLHATEHIRKIQRNLLLAAMSINCIIDDSRTAIQLNDVQDTTHNTSFNHPDSTTINLLDRVVPVRKIIKHGPIHRPVVFWFMVI
ncbi:hypothetical protein BDN70DRAFT_938584 [Pholiota conissans]|uniref:Uncharacterized protein n=1 Tax=Pholiota conissans TaxID=109636 RepID=A0A9P6CTA5_9AGAR|nr:hypothetical protein BDN70DRAFT_938584 [Pholiota conissans]